MKIVTVVGARPQFVKAAAVSREFKKYSEIQEIIVHTGQHFDQNMSDVFFVEMDIPTPDYSLQIHSMSHGSMTGRMLEKIEEVLLKEKPDFLLVYGDTNSTLAGALAARKLNIRVAHVEAGLRSFNMSMPEEVNRVLTDRISDILFCPTDTSVENLVDEGFAKHHCRIIHSGDVMLDAALYYAKMAEARSDIVQKMELDPGFVLCTIHRAENTDDIERLKEIFVALNELAKSHRVVLPLHPRTRKIVNEQNIKVGFNVIEPVGYFDMLLLIKGASVILTDSGGLQKEAFFFEKPCVTLRDETEWVELVDGGVNILAGAECSSILSATRKMLNAELNFKINYYGDGNAASLIVSDLLNT